MALVALQVVVLYIGHMKSIKPTFIEMSRAQSMKAVHCIRMGRAKSKHVQQDPESEANWVLDGYSNETDTRSGFGLGGDSVTYRTVFVLQFGVIMGTGDCREPALLLHIHKIGTTHCHIPR